MTGPVRLPAGALDRVRFDERGLVPVVVQEEDGTVLMLAWANREALETTLRTGQGHYWSRSRRELWRKGATSGHLQQVLDVRLDCDLDAVLYLVRQTGPACHLGTRSCFSPRE
jgi:phosphoribosyl-AMP cyclohydrolase